MLAFGNCISPIVVIQNANINHAAFTQVVLDIADNVTAHGGTAPP